MSNEPLRSFWRRLLAGVGLAVALVVLVFYSGAHRPVQVVFSGNESPVRGDIRHASKPMAVESGFTPPRQPGVARAPASKSVPTTNISESQSREEVRATLEKIRNIAAANPQVTFSGRSWIYRPDVVVVRAGESTDGMGAKLGSMPGFSFFSAKKAARADGLFYQGTARPHVVQDPTTGRFAFVTGTFVVKFRDFASADALSLAHGLEVLSKDPTISHVFYKPNLGADLVATLAALKSDPNVVRAELEVIREQAVPK